MKFSEFLGEKEERRNGTYTSALFTDESCNQLYEWASSYDLCDPEKLTPKDQYHCTVIYSRKIIPDEKQLNIKLDDRIAITGFKILRGKTGGDCLTILLDDKILKKYFEQCIEAGGTSDYPDFIAHTTLTYDFEGGQEGLKYLPLPKFDLQLKEIKSEPLNLNWAAKVNKDS